MCCTLAQRSPIWSGGQRWNALQSFLLVFSHLFFVNHLVQYTSMHCKLLKLVWYLFISKEIASTFLVRSAIKSHLSLVKNRPCSRSYEENKTFRHVLISNTLTWYIFDGKVWYRWWREYVFHGFLYTAGRNLGSYWFFVQSYVDSELCS